MVAIIYKGAGRINLQSKTDVKRDIVNGDILEVTAQTADGLKGNTDWTILKEKKDVNKKQKETKEMK